MQLGHGSGLPVPRAHGAGDVVRCTGVEDRAVVGHVVSVVNPATLMVDVAPQATVLTSSSFELGIADEVGTLEPGLLADVPAVAGNPLENIALLEDVRFVMKAGVVYKGPDAQR